MTKRSSSRRTTRASRSRSRKRSSRRRSRSQLTDRPTMTTRIVASTLVLFMACGTPARPQTATPAAVLDELLAPIALYPDQLLAQMLMSAADPAKVVELDSWLKANQKVKGTPLQDAAVKAGFDASFVAL